MLELNQVYQGDCLEVMKEMTDKSVDVIITDPPYGINMDKGFSGSGGFSGKGVKIRRRTYKDQWDKSRPDARYFKEMLRVSSKVFIFGGNFFADMLPQGRHWIVWDKLNTMPTFGDCELIWTNIDRKSVKKITYEYNGLIGKEERRYHPTQKPVGLIRELILKYVPEGQVILDPFAGSGTTGVAAKNLNRNFILIEQDKEYCNLIEKRLAGEYIETAREKSQPKPLSMAEMIKKRNG